LLERIFKHQIESVAHGVYFPPPMGTVTIPDQVEIRALDFFQIGVVALAAVPAQRHVAFRGARFHHVNEHDGQ
jgi:hypothetical protein